MNAFRVGLFSFGAFLFLGLIGVWMGVTWIGTGSVGFAKHISGEITEIPQGIHWKGFGVAVQEYPTYMQSLVLSTVDAKHDDSWKIGTADQQELTVSTNLTWRIDNTKGKELFQAVGGKDIDYVRDNIVMTTMKNVVNGISHKYGWNTLKGDGQAKITAEIQAQLDSELAKAGIRVGTFGFSHVSAPPGMEDAQKGLAASELATKQSQQAQEKAKIDNETTIMNTKAAAQAKQEQIKIEAESAVITAKATADANKLEAEGIKAKADVLTDKYIQAVSAGKWNGQVPTTMMGSNAVPFVNLPAPVAGK